MEQEAHISSNAASLLVAAGEESEAALLVARAAARSFVSAEHEASAAAAVERAVSVGAVLLTPAVSLPTLVDVYETKKCFNVLIAPRWVGGISDSSVDRSEACL